MNLSVNDFNNLDDIVAAVLDQLKAVLAANGLDALLRTLETDASKYHIHDITIEDILLGEGNSPYYVRYDERIHIPTQSISSRSIGVEFSDDVEDDEFQNNDSETTRLL